MKNINFWKKVSDYTAILALIMGVSFGFLKKYMVYKIIIILSYFGIIVIVLFGISELMKYLIKRKL